MGVKIPSLRKKLNLLVTYGPYNSVDEIAEKLGKRPKTILSWADGSPGAAPDNVPERNFAKLVAVFATALGTSEEKTRELLFMPPSWLEAAFRQNAGQSFRALLEAEADGASLRLIRARSAEGQLVETDFAPELPEHRLKLGERFRLVLERDLRQFNVFALQNANAQWGSVPLSIDASSGHVHLPGLHPDGAPAYMQERRDVGPNLFTVIACRQALPEALAKHAEEGTALDTATLVALADTLTMVPKSGRQLFCLSVVFEQG